MEVDLDRRSTERALPLPQFPASFRAFVHVMLPDMATNRMHLTSTYGEWRPEDPRDEDITDARHHWAYDIQGKGTTRTSKGENTSVCSPIHGEVSIVRNRRGVEIGVEITDATNGIKVMLLHITGRTVNQDDVITAGTEIGLMSDIGSRGAVHLHFGVKTRNSQGQWHPIDPCGDWADNYAQMYGLGNDNEANQTGCYIARPLGVFRLAQDYGGEFEDRDPLIVHIDGDGIETIHVQAGAYFDGDADGFAEQTGWVYPDDGLLVMDRNGDGIINDGNELFGDQTMLSDGTKAASGFQALAELDGNQDGRIDSGDAEFSRLRVWRDVDGDHHLGPGELSTLDELGITSIGLDSTTDGTADPQGNVRNSVATFEKMDGTSGEISEYGLQRDGAYSVPSEWLDVPEDIAALPYLQGYGTVHDLDQAMVRDNTGQLKSLVIQFMEADDVQSREALMHRVLFTWTGSQDIDPSSRGSNVDARKLSVLENFFGESFVGISGPSPTYEAGVLLKESYRGIFELMYSELMAQTKLQDLYDMIGTKLDGNTNKFVPDFSDLVSAVEQAIAANPEHGKLLLSEFARSIRAVPSLLQDHYLSLREHFIQQDPELAWVFDTGGLPVYDHLHQGTRYWSPHIEGTDNADAVKGSLTEGDRYINGLNGNDVIYGTTRDEILINETGDALLVAGGGKDQIWAGADDDILDGGTGNDILKGGTGNDTYIFRRGSGQDTIIDPDPTEGNVDTIWLGSNLTPDEITLRRSGNNLVLRIIGTSDSLTVQDYFRNDSPLNRVEQIQFMDGTLLTEEDILDLIYAPREGDDTLYDVREQDTMNGLGGNDRLYGLGGDDLIHGDDGNDSLYGADGSDSLFGDTGNDRLYGGSGADSIDGGVGNDVLDGGTGDDIYTFNRGSGQDTLYDSDTTPGNIDTIALGDGVLPTDVELRRVGNDLKLTITDTGDSITVKNWLQDDTPYSGVEAITFTDGTTWTTEDFQDLAIAGSDNNDFITGFARSETIDAQPGDDIVHARAGDDTISGGTGSDQLYGDAGADTLNGGDANDVLQGGTGDDILDGGAGNDSLYGGDEYYWRDIYGSNGNDTYLFGRGSGEDVIIDHDRIAGNVDTIRLADDLTPDDVKVQQNGDSLEILIDGTTDKLTVLNWFWNDSDEYRVEAIQFVDGTTWDVDTSKEKTLQGTDGDDILVGTAETDTLEGFGGNDKIYGREANDLLDGGTGDDIIHGEAGNDTLLGGEGSDKLSGGLDDDTLDGGAGNDTLYGGTEFDWYGSPRPNGNDTYRFGRGYGQDTIVDHDKTAGNLDRIVFNDDTASGDVTLRRSGDDLVLWISGTTDTLTVQDWFKDESTANQVEQIEFADGTILDVDAIKGAVLQGTPGDDILIGYSSFDSIDGIGGQDTIYGNAGNDTLEGGPGDDYLDGGVGNDEYVFVSHRLHEVDGSPLIPAMNYQPASPARSKQRTNVSRAVGAHAQPSGMRGTARVILCMNISAVHHNSSQTTAVNPVSPRCSVWYGPRAVE